MNPFPSNSNHFEINKKIFNLIKQNLIELMVKNVKHVTHYPWMVSMSVITVQVHWYRVLYKIVSRIKLNQKNIELMQIKPYKMDLKKYFGRMKWIIVYFKSLETNCLFNKKNLPIEKLMIIMVIYAHGMKYKY